MQIRIRMNPTFFVTFFLLFLQLECQLVPVSEVKTHPTKEAKKEKILTKLAKSTEPEDSNSKPSKLPGSDLMHFLITQYEASDVDDRVEILQNLEYFSHKYENGRDLFQATETLNTILLPALNSSSPLIRKGACGVFAAAAQNNKVVQNLSLETGVVHRLVQLMVIETETVVKLRALSAVTSLLRNFPEGQRLWIQDGGVPALVKVAFLPEMRKKGLLFITDLLAERELCTEADFEGTDHIDPCDRMQLLQKSLDDSDYCSLLVDSVHQIPNFDEDDQIIVIEAVKSSSCSPELSGSSSYFRDLLQTFEGDEAVKQSLENVLKQLESHRKDEL